jgi:hypothetical protein
MISRCQGGELVIIYVFRNMIYVVLALVLSPSDSWTDCLLLA